jgi:ornithine cyclodeaminase/alanine dehydrogenase
VSVTRPLRFLSARDVEAAMPALEQRLALAELTMTALAAGGGGELPPKIGVHPRPDGSFAHAMPAYLRAPQASGDLLGMKWIAGFGGNRAMGLPAIHGLVVLNDAATGVPSAILDAGPITALRTAAVSGVAVRKFVSAPPGRPHRVGIVGAGVQAASHLEVIAALLPGATVRIFDRHPERAAARAAATDGGGLLGDVAAAGSAREAVAGADLVVTAASFGPVRQVMTNDWLAPDALVVPVDYATYCAAEVARDAALFLVDHREQFLANREAGNFDDYPDPTATLGEAIVAATPRPAGRVVVTHLGVGLADVVFGAAILRRAEELDLGTVLER